jgi:protein-S-isoprenylcysteine O-methyltransferase Ste14
MIGALHATLWLAWFIYWRVAAQDTKATARRDNAFRWLYLTPLVGAFLCFYLPRPVPELRVTVFSNRELCAGIGTALLVGGLAFACWARVALGRNWSNVVTIKVGHELVQNGPYRWVRHPIYTGLLLAIAGTALTGDLWMDLAAVPLVFVAFWIKLRREETWMMEQFGAAYIAYAKRTARLIPFVL